MSPKKTTLAAALLVLALSACGTKPTKFPAPPELLMREPQTLVDNVLKDDPVLSDVATQHAEETTVFYEVREQLLSLQSWIRRMQDVAEK